MQLKTYSLEQHGVSANQIDPDALLVVQKLNEAGFLSYVVGGGIRDLILKEIPKDFDIVTSARPEQIRRLFRNCLLIGRRFRLAHIRFGKKIIEVATFRAGDIDDADLIIRDNNWGSPEEDVLRRDLTINGLFYDPLNECIVDYVGGYEDIKKGVLRTIGLPVLRFKQDPVRMLRLLKFNARFGLEIDPVTYQALLDCRFEIKKSSAARVLEEILRMLESGAAYPFFKHIVKTEILEPILPAIYESLKGPCAERIFHFLQTIDVYLKNTNHPRLPREVLLCGLLFPQIEYHLEKEFIQREIVPQNAQVLAAINFVLERSLGFVYHFPRKLYIAMTYILQQQYRLTPFDLKKPQPLRLLRHKEFPLALQFLAIRAFVDHSLHPLLKQWKKAYDKTCIRLSSQHHKSVLEDLT